MLNVVVVSFAFSTMASSTCKLFSQSELHAKPCYVSPNVGIYSISPFYAIKSLNSRWLYDTFLDIHGISTVNYE